jgi:RadC-like JAB domain
MAGCDDPIEEPHREPGGATLHGLCPRGGKALGKSHIAFTLPARPPTPSRAKIGMTKRIVEIARGLGIEAHDHIIVGRDGQASLKGLKLF